MIVGLVKPPSLPSFLPCTTWLQTNRLLWTTFGKINMDGTSGETWERKNLKIGWLWWISLHLLIILILETGGFGILTKIVISPPRHLLWILTTTEKIPILPSSIVYGLTSIPKKSNSTYGKLDTMPSTLMIKSKDDAHTLHYLLNAVRSLHGLRNC